MARERMEFFRESNVSEKEKIVVLAFEGNETEKQYFSAFRDSENFNDKLIYLHLLTRDAKDTRSAPKHVFNKLKTEARDIYNFNKTDELWMIIDTDRWGNIPEIIELCKSHENMFVAVSNPCFELWLLLHIADVDSYDDEESEKILKNKKITNKKNYIDTKIADIIGSYNKSKLNALLFLPHIDTAIERAKKLDFELRDYPIKLGSHVYKLIEKIKV